MSPEIAISRARIERIERLADAGTKVNGRSAAAAELEALEIDIRLALEAYQEANQRPEIDMPWGGGGAVRRDHPTETETRLDVLERELAAVKRELADLQRATGHRPGYELRPFALPERRHTQTTERT
ncbi:MAG: hypothetical protein ACLQMH_11200 [Solirubrobacteraceae bacterium]